MKPATAAPADLAECEREPIHIPGHIQPHGFLLASPGIDAPITHVSENARSRAGRGAALLGRSWADVLGDDAATMLRQARQDGRFCNRPISLGFHPLAGADAADVELIAHERGGFLVVEAEDGVERGVDLPAEALSLELAPLLARLGEAATVGHLCQLVTDEARRLTRFDRVLIYQFDEDWNGNVVAESRNEALPSYLGHRFPAFDIPPQARRLYHVNRLRLIADAGYAPVSLLAASADLPPLDLTLGTLRGISPVHLEYMRNMGTGSSMSASIMRGEKLWGLLSCHGRDARRLSFATRSVCDLLGQIFSLQLAGREQERQLSRQITFRQILARMLAGMSAADDFASALERDDLLALAAAHGAALVRGDQVFAFGATPSEEALLRLRDWAAARCREGIFHTDRLPSLYSEIGDAAALATGLLAISISPVEQCYAFWFRAELAETVTWGGQPRKNTELLPDGVRMHPRKSFEAWKETVRGRAAPWEPAELESAMNFRRSVIDIVLKQAAAKAALATELQRANKELEAFTYTVSHDLRAPFRHVQSYSELLNMDHASRLDEDGRYLLGKILKSAEFAGDLVDTLLAFSRMNLVELAKEDVDLARLVDNARIHATYPPDGRAIEWRVAPDLPTVRADAGLLALVFQNLFENAVKYTAKRHPALIEVSARATDAEWIVTVKDNGAGFDMRYVDKLFGVFQRLHSHSEFPGLGIGLANVRRIVERHGGRVWAEGRVDEGAAFHFSLPFPSDDHAQAHPSR